MTIHEKSPERMHWAHRNNCSLSSSKIPKDIPEVVDDDYIRITLEINIDFDPVESEFDFLKDTALSPNREEVLNNKLPKFNDRRTLVYFLSNKDPYRNFLDYFEKYNLRHQDRLKNCVIKLTQKEKELKVEGRMFGQSPYVERFRRCLLEHNVSRAMKYNNDQMMIFTENQKMLKIMALKSLYNETHWNIAFSIDVEAWNNMFNAILC